MIMSESFAHSQKARDNEFTTNKDDKPLVVQFAANKVEDFVTSAQLVADHCQGVDLNCGCPQRWALKEGIGACLIDKPEFVSDLVRQTRNRTRDDLLVSVKIRIHSDIRRTVELCRQMEQSGASFVSVHGRTKDQRSDPVNLEAIRTIKQSLGIPVVANGDIKSMADVIRVKEATDVDGVMAARGILENPAMFSSSGAEATPIECVESWIRIAVEVGTPFPCFHHHLSYMLERLLSRAERKFFNQLTSTAAVLDYLKDKYGVVYKPSELNK